MHEGGPIVTEEVRLHSPSPMALPAIRILSPADLWAALVGGWSDYLANPVYGLFFAAAYAAGGVALYLWLIGMGDPFWFAIAVAGFPLLAPFAAAGLYEVSRRRQANEPLSWGLVLVSLRGRGDGQVPMMGIVVLVIFGFWLVMARGIFAIFFGHPGSGLNGLAALTTSAPGMGMLLIGGLVGALMALVLFTITVFSLPMLVHRPVDFVTAIITSIAAVRINLRIMLVWAFAIAFLLAIAMLPAFLGLLVVLPVLGHASWHLYRRAIASD